MAPPDTAKAPLDLSEEAPPADFGAPARGRSKSRYTESPWKAARIMTAASTEQLGYFVDQMRSTIPDDLHPSGHATIHGWLQEMRWAADEGDTATVARRAKHIEAKIERENSARSPTPSKRKLK
jgi:hypothetical protein